MVAEISLTCKNCPTVAKPGRETQGPGPPISRCGHTRLSQAAGELGAAELRLSTDINDVFGMWKILCCTFEE